MGVGVACGVISERQSCRHNNQLGFQRLILCLANEWVSNLKLGPRGEMHDLFLIIIPVIGTDKSSVLESVNTIFPHPAVTKLFRDMYMK